MDPVIMYFLFILGIVITMYAQFKVQHNFSKYSRVANTRRLTGGEVARIILDRNGLSNIRIEGVRGSLTDHYSPNEGVLRLSESVYNVESVAAIAVAAHEAGHAIQHRDDYGPMKFRSALVPLANLGSRASSILILLGLIFQTGRIFDLGILFFSLAVLFYIITLPVEFNASKRALNELSRQGLIAESEYGAAKNVLSAAALTYVASALSAVFYLLRLMSMRERRD